MNLEEQTVETIHSYKDTPWCNNPKAYQNIVHEDDNLVVFKDRYPVTEGHLLFVPKKRAKKVDITICFEYAYDWGVKGVCDRKWDAFNVGINNGVEAGQSVMWPHVHMIPRRKGDHPNPRGGVRNVIPDKGDYKEDEWLSADHWSKRIQESNNNADTVEVDLENIKEELAQIAEASHRTVEELFSPVAKINKMCTENGTEQQHKPKFDW